MQLYNLKSFFVQTKDCVLIENLLDYTSEEFEETGTTPIANGRLFITVSFVNNFEIFLLQRICFVIAINYKFYKC